MTPDPVHLYRGQTVVVTGSNGYLGSALTAALLASDARVVPVKRPDADVRTIDCWNEIVACADVIIHLAGNTSVECAEQDPAGSLQSTVQPIALLAQAARTARRCPRVVFASSATVYGITERLPVGEDVEPAPETTYDRHKLLAERELASATDSGLVDGVSLRLANVYGPSPARSSSTERGVLNAMTERAIAGDELCLFGDGNYLRDYLYIDDAVRAFLVAGLTRKTHGSFNVASGVGATLRDAFQMVVERAERRTGLRSSIREVAWPAGGNRIGSRQFIASVDRMAATFGWRPAISLSDGIDRLIEDMCDDRL